MSATDSPSWPFPGVPFERWLEAVEAGLGGRRWQDLASTTEDGVPVDPLCTPDVPGPRPEPGEFPGLEPFHRHARAAGPLASGIEIRQEVDDPDPERAARTASLVSRHGAGAVSVVVAGADPDGRGVRLGDPAALERVLAGVDPERVRLALEAGPRAPELAPVIGRVRAGRGPGPSFGCDPLVAALRTGETVEPDRLRRALAEFFGRAREIAPDAVPLAIEARAWAEAGAGPALELGLALAAGATFVRALLGAGVAPGDAVRGIELRFALGREPFVDIARLRAARLCWARLAEHAGADEPDRAARIHAAGVPALRTRHDPWVNLLRGTVEAFAAIVGGAESVTTVPFDVRRGVPDAAGRRLAAHTPWILAREAHLDRVIDPAGGSWFVEHLTARLARRAWQVAQEIEREGGIVAALAGGTVERLVGASLAERERRVRTREAPLTGVSTTPWPDEPPLGREPWPEPEGAAGGLLARRPWAAPFEALRDRVDAHAARAGVRPVVLLATLGAPAAHRARALWARHVVEAGGVRAADSGPLGDAAAAAAALREHGAAAAVICGADEDVAGLAAPVAQALREAGARRVLLAGRPPGGTLPDGVDERVAAGDDVVAVLERLLAALEVA
ncbi:MAG: methylmalonyl-CoA mutase [Acidobacteria bacterium]|nr:MAG: methylmalonyl-CoA mutase [Acidobacteriota bacterium]